MPASLVLTVIGPDRPGLVEALSETVAAHEANWVESRMARLGGHFAGLLRVQLDPARTEALTAALAQLESAGLRVQLEVEAQAPTSDADAPLVLELTGQDRPGIVRDVARALARQGVNVEELETACEPAPMSGEILFRARARLRKPASLSDEALRAALEPIANELMVDIALGEETDGS
jgi:glycine cleavage system regulatory protein